MGASFPSLRKFLSTPGGFLSRNFVNTLCVFHTPFMARRLYASSLSLMSQQGFKLNLPEQMIRSYITPAPFYGNSLTPLGYAPSPQAPSGIAITDDIGGSFHAGYALPYGSTETNRWNNDSAYRMGRSVIANARIRCEREYDVLEQTFGRVFDLLASSEYDMTDVNAVLPLLDTSPNDPGPYSQIEELWSTRALRPTDIKR